MELNIFALTKPQNILIMETKDRLQKYKFENYTIVTNFETYQDAENFAKENSGELIEVGFTDGADNPLENPKANLIADKKTFRVELPYSDYKVYYSYDEGFQEMAKSLQFQKKEADNDMFLEDILSDQNIAAGDRIIIVDDKKINTITTRERIKFLMGGNLYELAVKIANTEV